MAVEEEEAEAADEGEIRMGKKRRRRSRSTSPRFNATIVSGLDTLLMSEEAPGRQGLCGGSHPGSSSIGELIKYRTGDVIPAYGGRRRGE